MRVGLLEDDAIQRDLLRQLIESAGHEVQEFACVADCLDMMSRDPVDLLVIDWRLPDGDGGEVISWVRNFVPVDLPIMVVTVMGEDEDIVKGLSLGADDFVVKPIVHSIFVARLEALARRNRLHTLTHFRLGPYMVDAERAAVCIEGNPVPMTQREFDLASYFLGNPNKVFSRQHLLCKIWGINADVDSRTVDMFVSRLRKKLELDGTRGWKLSTVYGQGYRLDRIEPARPDSDSVLS